MKQNHMAESSPRLRLADTAGNPVTLTRQEAKVLSLLAEGLDAREIAAELFVATATVSFHVHGINRALGVPSARKAVAMAYETRLRDSVKQV